MAAEAKLAKERSGLSLAVGDALATAFFVFVSSTFDEVAEIIGPALGMPALAAGLSVLVGGLIVFGPVADWLGGPGALFNPSHNLAFAALGQGKKRTHLMRMVFQIIGGVLGAVAALVFIPVSWQRNFYKMALGPRPGVSLRVAVLTEGLLTYLLNLVILYATSAENKYLAYWSPLVATVALVTTGAELTGPSMNPAFTFGWFAQLGTIAAREHFLVFWLGPLLGGLLAGLTWRAFVVTKPNQQPGNAVLIDKPAASDDSQQTPEPKKAK